MCVGGTGTRCLMSFRGTIRFISEYCGEFASDIMMFIFGEGCFKFVREGVHHFIHLALVVGGFVCHCISFDFLLMLLLIFKSPIDLCTKSAYLGVNIVSKSLTTVTLDGIAILEWFAIVVVGCREFVDGQLLWHLCAVGVEC